MPDARISELPLATALTDTDYAPLVQSAGSSSQTRRATFAQQRAVILADRGAHVRDYGAVGDGATNDAPAIQAAIDDLRTRGGGTLFFGPRVYRIASGIVLNNATVRLQGQGFTEGPGPGQGTWLRIDGTGFTPFSFTGVYTRGAGVADIAVQQIHTAPLDASWAPDAYPYVFRVEDCLGGIDFDNVFLCNVNRGIYCRNSGRLDIRRLRGQVFTAGIEIDEAYDLPRLHNLHFWTFWSDNNNVVRWQQANGDALIFRRSDGAFIDQAFALGYRSMFRFGSSAAGVTTKFYIGQAYADFVQYGVWLEASGTDGQIAGFTSQQEIFNSGGALLAGAAALQISGSNCRVQIGNLRVDAVQDSAVRLLGTGNRADIFGLRCIRINTRGNGAPAISIADSGTGTPNAVYLGSPALIENANGGPLVNSGTNGVLALGAPAGRAAAPGLSVGGTDSGLFQPAAGTLAAAVGGTEVLRATGAGAVTLGGAPGSHGLEVATPGGTVNRVVASGAATGAAVSLAAQGSDPNIGITLGPKGSGALRGPTPAASDNSTALATTAYVRAQGYLTAAPVTTVAGRGGAVTLAVADVAGAAPLASPAFTGVATVQDGGAAAPGLGFAGSASTGLYRAASGGLALTVGGAEVLRATSGGSVTLGGAPGGHALEVATPVGTVNQVLAAGSPTGGTVSLQAQGADANIGLSLPPKGAGALTAQVPDSTSAGGNARGANAVDWQTTRSAATQVASGASAMVGGGASNTASGQQSVVAGGTGNAATGTQTVIAGGSTNNASGTLGWVPGGQRGSTRGIWGRGAWAAGNFSATGDAQAGEHVLRAQTTNATVTRLTGDGGSASSTNQVVLPANGTYRVKLLAVARQTGGSAGTAGDSASWEADVLIRRGASAAATVFIGGRTFTGTPAIAAVSAGVGVAPGIADSGAAAWRLTLDADTTNGGIALSGTGEVNKSLNWVARILSAEVVG